MNSIPNCLVLPSLNGSLNDCVVMNLPSASTVIMMLIFSWIIIMVVAYGIYYFLNKNHPMQRVNYWMILLILVLAGIIVSLLSSLFMKF